MAKSKLGELQDRVAGQVVAEGETGYDDARVVYNAMIDRRPQAVVRCTNVDDVRAAVIYAREHGLELAVRGGGHSAPGFGTVDGGIVIDLSGMRAVTVDPQTRTATAQGGATWGDFNDATAVHGLATTGGVVSTTGVGGLTLGGGIGYLARGLGLSCDNLISAEVVTADGQRVVASETEHDDLFWALRGGGGNFGVVTTFEFRLSPVSTIYGGPIFFELENVPDVLRFFREFIADAPEQYGGFPAFQIAPPLPVVPENRVGEPFIALVNCWTGAQKDGERIIADVRSIARPVAEMVGPMPYPALNSAFDALVPKGLQHYWKANFVTELSDALIDAHVAHGPKIPTVNSAVHIYPINGVCHQVPADATAFAYREANFATVIAGMWPDPADNEANTRWVRDYYAATAPLSEDGGYVNFMAADDQGRIQSNYRGNYARLVQVKQAYDPDNVFHLNQNIRP